MRLGELIAGLDARLMLAGQTAARDADSIAITSVTQDSRHVKPGALFAALAGSRLDGGDFIAAALERGAVAVLAAPETSVPAGVARIEAGNPRRVLAQIASRLAGARPHTLVAITGTNGKTSSVDFLRQIWNYAGIPAASIGTLGIIAAGQPVRDSLTTPDPVQLAQELARLKALGIDTVAMEASSHGLDQARLDGVALAAAGFTNLTRDHLDYHGSMEAYAAAKLRLFDVLLPEGAPAVANTVLDPDVMNQLRAITGRRGLRLETVGDGGSLLDLRRVTPVAHGQVLEVITPDGKDEILLPLAGRYQADNVLMAAGLALLLQVPQALAALPGLQGVRGRLELVARLAQGGAAYVDYAHTPDAIERLCASLRPHCAGRLILVFGAGGDRDPGKRPLMGAAAGRGADVAIITDDNPRSEPPAQIRAAIKAACADGIEIGDRKQAIAAALGMAAHQDVVVVAGKGHEQGQIVAGQVLPFDDAAVIRALLGEA